MKELTREIFKKMFDREHKKVHDFWFLVEINCIDEDDNNVFLDDLNVKKNERSLKKHMDDADYMFDLMDKYTKPNVLYSIHFRGEIFVSKENDSLYYIRKSAIKADQDYLDECIIERDIIEMTKKGISISQIIKIIEL